MKSKRLMEFVDENQVDKYIEACADNKGDLKGDVCIELNAIYVLYSYSENYLSSINDMRDVNKRRFKTLSLTKTHVYIKNMKTGERMNVPIEDFRRDFKGKSD